MKIRFRLLVIILVLSTFLAACGGQEQDIKNTTEVDNKQVLEVYTTIFPLMDFTKKIGGEHVQVNNLVPAGADAHTYEPTAKKMVAVANADLYIYNGAGIEGFADAVAEVLKEGKVKVIKASEGIELIEVVHGEESYDEHASEEENGHEEDHDDHGHENEEESHDDQVAEDGHNHGGEDPHIWLDPIRSVELAENIKDTLVELNPEAKDAFESNFMQLKEQLEGLDQKFQEMVEEVPLNTFVVSHAGYGYWTDRYGIKQVSISGISPSNEPSIKQIQEVINYIEDNNISFIIFEKNIPTSIVETVRSQVGAEALWLHNLEALAQEDIDNNEDYFSLMERNIETLRTALQ